MFLYVVSLAILGVVGGVLLSVLVKRNKSVEYKTIDKVGVITNFVLAAVYTLIAPFYMFIGMISTPHYDGFLGFIGLVVCLISGSAALAAGVSIGGSVALRRRGNRVLSFIVQFAGILSIALTFVFYVIFAGNLISPLN